MIYKPPFPTDNTDAKFGYALLLALMITSAVLSAASALSRIVLSEIRQTREIINSIQAYANAESSSEAALFLLRKSQPEIDLAAALPAGVSLEDIRQEAQFFRVAENDFISLTIPLDAADSTIAPRIDPWILENPACPSWMEVTTISWDQNAVSTEETFKIKRYPFSYADRDTVANSDNIPFPPGIPIELRVRALFCDISHLGIAGIPGRVRVLSSAEVGGVRQTLEMLLPRRAPLTGLFDFVIFSAEEIIKQ